MLSRWSNTSLTQKTPHILTNRALARRRQGVAATEFALLLPLLAFLFVITLDYSRIFYFTMIVNNCARNGAIYGCQNPTAANDTSGILTNAQMDAGNINLNNLTVTSTTDSGTNPTYVEVTASYSFATITSYPGVPSSTQIVRTVRMSVTPWTPN